MSSLIYIYSAEKQSQGMLLIFRRDVYILWCMVIDANKIDENEAMREALREVEDMKKNPSKYQGYTDIDEMMRDLLA